MIGVTIMGKNPGFTNTTLYFSERMRSLYEGYFQPDRLPWDNDLIALPKRKLPFLIVARQSSAGRTMTWIGYYKYAQEPGGGRDGFCAVGVWLAEEVVPARLVIQPLHDAVDVLMDKLGLRSGRAWAHVFTNITLADLGLDRLDDKVVRLATSTKASTAGLNGRQDMPMCYVDCGDVRDLTPVYSVVDALLSRSEFSTFRQAYISSTQAMAQAAARQPQLHVAHYDGEADDGRAMFSFDSKPQEPRSLALLAPENFRTASASVADSRLGDDNSSSWELRLILQKVTASESAISEFMRDLRSSRAQPTAAQSNRQVMTFGIAAAVILISGLVGIYSLFPEVRRDVNWAQQPSYPLPPPAKPAASTLQQGMTVTGATPSNGTEMITATTTTGDVQPKQVEMDRTAKDLREIKDQLTRLTIQLAKSPLRQQELSPSATKAQDLIDRFLEGLPKPNPTQPGSGSLDTGSNNDTNSFKTIDPTQKR